MAGNLNSKRIPSNCYKLIESNLFNQYYVTLPFIRKMKINNDMRALNRHVFYYLLNCFQNLLYIAPFYYCIGLVKLHL